MGYEPTSRNSLSENQHFVARVLVSSSSSHKIPFELIIHLPRSRYERNIVERDKLGRIVHSKTPRLQLDYISQEL